MLSIYVNNRNNGVRMRTHKVVKVEWDDSMSYGGWRGRDDKLKGANCMSCGILVKVKKGYIGITHSMGDTCNDEIGDVMVIPRHAIKKIEVILTFKR